MMGAKTRAKAAMRAAGLDVIPGSDGVLASADDARAVAAEVGFPVLFKAEQRRRRPRHAGRARRRRGRRPPYAEAQAEARAAFGGDRVYLEKLIEGGRHVEIQVFGDRYGRAVHLGERDCTVQRNHQKLIEESPSPALTPTCAPRRARPPRARPRGSATSAPARWRCCSIRAARCGSWR